MTDLLERLRHLDPVDEDALRREPVPEKQLQHILTLPRSSPPRQSSRRRGGTLVLALVGGLVAVLVLAFLPDDNRTGQPGAAVALLAAAQAAKAQSPQTQAGPYAYSRIEVTSLGTYATDPPFSVLVRRVEERWVGPDGTGRMVSTPARPAFPSSRDERRWKAAGSPLGKAVRQETMLNSSELAQSIDPSLPPVDDLPTEPGALHTILREAAIPAGAPINVRMFELVAELLSYSGTSPRLRAALFTVASGIEGIENLGTTRDPLGRPGQAVAIRSSYSGSLTRQLLIYDPASAQLLASRTELLEPVPYTGGPTIHYRLLVDSGRTVSAEARP